MKPNEIIKDRIKQILEASNQSDLTKSEYFAHGAAVTLWQLGVFTQKEHSENYDEIVKAKKQREGELK